MTYIRLRYLFVIVLLMVAQFSFAVDFESTTSAVVNMKVGWNLGNTLDSNSGDTQNTIYGEWGTSNSSDYENNRSNNLQFAESFVKKATDHESCTPSRIGMPNQEHLSMSEFIQSDSLRSGIKSNYGDDYEFDIAIFGDINNDKEVSLIDILLQVDYILSEKEVEGFSFDRADLDGDGEISLLDILIEVDIILGNNNDAPPVYTPRK